MKILVTGATGFIGYHIIHYLLNNGYEVIATGTSREKAMQRDWFSRVKFVEHFTGKDDTQTDLYIKFDRPVKLIHLAWPGLPDYKSPAHIEEYLPAQYAFLENMICNGLKDVTITGTCFEYGMKNGLLTENMEPEPANPYAVAKDSLRRQLMMLQATHSFSLKWIRLFYMYGKGQHVKSLIIQLDAALAKGENTFNMSGGQQVRDYLPVEKVAENIARIAMQNKITGIINCSSNKPVTVESMVREYLKQVGGKIELNLGYYPYPDYEPMEFWGDNTKMLKALEN